MQVLTEGCEPAVWQKGGRRGLVTSYRCPIVTMGLSLTVFAVIQLDGICLAKRRY